MKQKEGRDWLELSESVFVINDGRFHMFTTNEAKLRRTAEQNANAFRKALADQPASVQHADDQAVDRFAAAMKEKLAKARDKGRSGWETCPPEDLSRMLREHVEKGDPRDVANFAMMLWNLGAAIEAQA